MYFYLRIVKTSSALLIWVLAVAVIISLEARVALADPVGVCNNGCSCSGNGCCPGCQIAFETPPAVGYYIRVPSCADSVYNYCNADGSNFSCVTQTVACYTTLPAPALIPVFTDGTCVFLEMTVGGPLPFQLMAAPAQVPGVVQADFLD